MPMATAACHHAIAARSVASCLPTPQRIQKTGDACVESAFCVSTTVISHLATKERSMKHQIAIHHENRCRSSLALFPSTITRASSTSVCGTVMLARHLPFCVLQLVKLPESKCDVRRDVSYSRQRPEDRDTTCGYDGRIFQKLN